MKSCKSEDFCAIKQIEEDLKSFYNYCLEQNICQEDIKKICAPLHAKEKKVLRVLIIAIIIFGLIYGLSQIDFFAWHFSAIGRILMIKLLPFYNWQVLKNEKCLIKRYEQPKFPINCYFCESINFIPVSYKVDPEILKKRFLDLDLPIIFEQKNEIYNISYFIEKILEVPAYYEGYPCEFASNIPKKRGEFIGEFLERLEDHTKFFLHYQNCDFEDVKVFRTIFGRPNYFFDEISPIQYSWVLMSKNYKTKNFKEIKTRDSLMAFEQLLGSNVLRLHPLNDCFDECESLEIVLKTGEVLLLTDAWNLEYKPGDEEENFAVIYEAH